jgi:tetratricopeptide (TPR) repeat protein
MTPLAKLRATAFRIILPLAIGLALLYGCAGDPEGELVAAVPGIDRPLARHLVSDDDSTLARFAQTVGIYPFRDAGSIIVARFHSETSGEFNETRKKLLPTLRRIAAVYLTEFASGHYEMEVDFWSAASGEVAVRLGELRASRTSALLDTALTTPVKIDEIRRVLAEYETVGYLPGIAHCKHEIGNLLAQTDKSEQKLYYRRALADAERAEMHPIVCQILGTLGHEAALDGDTDSMFVYWNRSRAVAERHKLPDYAARIYAFYGQHYITEGRLALAHDLFQEAQTVCRELKGGYHELRFAVKLIEFYNDLGCWDISGRMLQRAAVLETQVPEDMPGGVYSFKLRAALARARYLMAKGEVDDAEVILNDLKPFVKQQLHRDQYPRMLYQWSRDLLENGRPDPALPPIDEGLAWCEEVNFPYLVPKFHVLRAELEYERGDYDAALAAVASFESSTRRFPRAPYQREWLTGDVIRARVLFARGDADSAVTELEGALSRLEGYLAERDASTHGYLWLGQSQDLRELLHELTAGDPVASYGAELYWRELYQRLGGGQTAGGALAPGGGATGPDSTSAGGMLAGLRRIAVEAHDELRRTNRVHCSYRVTPDRMYRITATPDGIREDRLSVPVGELSRLVSDVWDLMSDETADPTAPAPRALVTPLRALALQLLPREILEVRVVTPKPILFSVEGFLASLPFETLNLAADGSYRPLLKDWDVAYLRRAYSLRPARPVSGELLVADPALSASTRRRLSVSQPLPEASREASEIAALLDDATILDGPRATKPGLVDAWGDASLVYVAAHFLANPEVPYLTLLPLADKGTSAAPDAALVDVGDVRESDLRGCRLVVLSGCATGAPYMAGETAGPGFGDVFLDAGAGAVVQTFWAVRDEQAREQMSEFMRAWRSMGRSPVRALNRVRRDSLELEGEGGVRHPFYWAAFSLKLGHL